MRVTTLLTTIVAAIVALGMAGVLPDTARSAPESECESDPYACLYPYEEVKMPLMTINGHGYSCTVEFELDWGDGSRVYKTTLPPWSDERVSHVYTKPGLYTITVKGTPLDPPESKCHNITWSHERSVEVLQPIVKITELTLNDIDNTPLKFLSTDDHTYFSGNTRIHGTITVKGRPTHALESLVLEVRGEDGTLAKAKLAPGVKNTLLTTFGSDRKVVVSTSKLLFLLPSAQAALLDTEENGRVGLKVVAKTKPISGIPGLKDIRAFGSVPKLVRYTDTNRYGGRDATKGGDDWVKPSVRTVAEHFSGILWGDFSNMNGGRFAPHSSHKTGNDIDGVFGGYGARNQAVAQTIIGHLNDDTYGSRIEKVFVTFNAPGTQPLTCESGEQDTNHSGFWQAIQNVTLDDGRTASDVIRPVSGHCTHFHWLVSDQ